MAKKKDKILEQIENHLLKTTDQSRLYLMSRAPSGFVQKPSDLIFSALEDMDYLSKKGWTLSDGMLFSRIEGKASLSGVYLIRRLPPPFEIKRILSPFYFEDRAIHYTLMALDLLSFGAVGGAFTALGLNRMDASPFNQHISSPLRSKRRFTTKMKDLAFDLKCMGF